MALIEKRKGRKDGGYGRLFGNTELGELISKVQGAVISAGTELERIIKAEVQQIESLDDFLQQEIMQDGVFLADKWQVKRSTTFNFAGSEPDFIIFRRREGKQHCYLVELKDGDAFDTKKSAAEHRSMHDFISKNAHNLHYTLSAHFCCFNQDSRAEVVKGFKDMIAMSEALTGREFCRLLEIEYDTIVDARKADQPENLAYFVKKLTGIKAVQDLLNKRRG